MTTSWHVCRKKCFSSLGCQSHIKHLRDFSEELLKARKVAELAVKYGFRSTAQVKHIGLNSVIANQIIRKYRRNSNIKKVSRVCLTVPGQSIRHNPTTKTIYVSSLKLTLQYVFSGFTKINQIEVGKEYATVSVTVPENEQIQPTSWLGVDRNTTGHCCVVSNPKTGKTLKLGKIAYHIHKKYKSQRRRLQKKRKFRVVKKIRNRESRIVRDLNHKISRKVVDYALKNSSGIVLEDLSGIRNKKKRSKSFNHSLHSWSFYQLQKFVEYKAKLLGVPVVKIDPAYTSQQCSRCGLLGNRNKKSFECPTCGHVDNADVNASFTIALRHQGILQLPIDRDIGKGSTDTPQEATAQRMQTLKSPKVISGGMSGIVS
jgi:putative transposase